MKTLNLVFTIVLLAGLSFSAKAQMHDHSQMNQASSKTESFKVWGNCDMCKARIEKAVKAEGVTNANWDEKTKMLTVTFDPSKTGKDGLSKKIASVGHDTEKYKAPNDVYEKLPGCCQYERAK
ncbi:MAG: cation transporter [Bacteroidia bacterium]|nr:cation transporter [Bacteroidia bacterium]